MLLSHSAASTFIEKAARIFSGSRRLPLVWKVAPFPPWSQKMRRLDLGLAICAISTSVAKTACRLFLGRKSCAVPTVIGKVAQSPPRSQNCWLSCLVAKIWNWQIFVRKVWTYQMWIAIFRSRHLCFGRESRSGHRVVLTTKVWKSQISAGKGRTCLISVAKV